MVIIRKQEATIKNLEAKFKEQNIKILELSETIKLLTARMYGKSEILNPDQLSLFEDSTKDDEPSNEPSTSTEVEEYVVHRRKKAKGVRQANIRCFTTSG